MTITRHTKPPNHRVHVAPLCDLAAFAKLLLAEIRFSSFKMKGTPGLQTLFYDDMSSGIKARVLLSLFVQPKMAFTK